MVIAIPAVEVLRRPLESAQYAAGDYRDILQAAVITVPLRRRPPCGRVAW
jgi:hypothetical protein